ncbi:hypothetical protein GOODEAATRI_004761 [Goodea atripinnis]|uniref:Uncharacterized protein n=1 Tax=Goodea atripinnis TaxID=208336 RepID=A0ABV0PW30_9TELE
METEDQSGAAGKVPTRPNSTAGLWRPGQLGQHTIHTPSSSIILLCTYPSQDGFCIDEFFLSCSSSWSPNTRRSLSVKHLLRPHHSQGSFSFTHQLALKSRDHTSRSSLSTLHVSTTSPSLLPCWIFPILRLDQCLFLPEPCFQQNLRG